MVEQPLLEIGHFFQTNLLTSMDLGSQILPNEGESLRTKCREIALSVVMNSLLMQKPIIIYFF